MIKKAKEIITGWKNVVFTDEEIEKLSAERMEVCNACPFKQFSEILKMEICGECLCPLKAKTRSPLSNCPKKKWLAKSNI
ncbi:MAG: hypothetical protein QM737_02765 [Ferruginibacter sp.]